MWALGADIGKSRDHTALAAVEGAGGDLLLRHAERVALGLAYPKIGAHVAGVYRAASALLPEPRSLVVDASGVGRPVLDHLPADLAAVGVVITGGKKELLRESDGIWLVPKRRLLGPLVSVLEAGRFKVAKGLPAGDALLSELKACRRIIGEAGSVTFGGVGEHDDLVIAVALAAWRLAQLGAVQLGSAAA